MLEEIAKNIWILLTLVIPGMFTYGTWRLILLLEPGKRLNTADLTQLDNSALVTTCVIVAIAILQQAFAILIEAVLASMAKLMCRRWPNFYSLFCERFALAAAGKLNENATRIIGNFFLTTNISFGTGLLLIYFIFYESLDLRQWIPVSLLVILVISLGVAAFRLINAIWVVEDCKKREAGNKII